MAHETFYRKYRSQTFDEIIGQEHIVQTLKNAIESDRLAHAYIFSGPRGTGKTSTARILAKALNCREGKAATPCLKCDLCVRITRGNAVDVIEIDAASNTGVDNIRVLNEQVNYAPVECIYKLYIIDEAHMLSTGAFNALLKTVEEPPENTLFILATTEPHKIPVTIHSRCQHLGFNKITSTNIVQQLQMIAKEESIEISEKSLNMVARNSSGCMRDAISLFDQIYSFKGEKITEEDVIFILGSANFDKLAELLGMLLSQNLKDTLKTLDQIIQDGANVSQLLAELTEISRQMLFVKMDLGEQLSLDDSRESKIKELADQIEINKITNLMETLAKTESDIRYFQNPELLLQARFISIYNQLKETQEIQPQSQVIVQQAPEKPSTPPFQKPQSMPVPPPQQSQNPEPQAVAAPDKIEATADQSDLEKWQATLKILQEKKSPVHSILVASILLGITDNQAVIRLKQDFGFFRSKLSEDTNKNTVEAVLRDVFNKPLQLAVSSANSIETPAPTTQAASQEVQPQPSPIVQESQNLNTGNTKINQIIDMFEGKVIQ
jgi:DNA polymerase III subunit gamma/tau